MQAQKDALMRFRCSVMYRMIEDRLERVGLLSDVELLGRLELSKWASNSRVGCSFGLEADNWMVHTRNSSNQLQSAMVTVTESSVSASREMQGGKRDRGHSFNF